LFVLHVCIGLGLMSFLASYDIIIYTLLLFLQVSIKTPAQIDIVLLSGSASKNPTVEERISKLTGDSAAYCILILSCVFVMRCKDTIHSLYYNKSTWSLEP
jgi:hypothetical protein